MRYPPPHSTLPPSVLLRPLDDDDHNDNEETDADSRGRRSPSLSPSRGARSGEGGEGLAWRSIDEIAIALKERRRHAENLLLSKIEDDVSRATWAALNKTLQDLRSHSIDHKMFSFTASSILKNHPQRFEELRQLMRPGTEAYVFTARDEALEFRPFFDVDDLMLDWAESGDNFSSMCVLCQSNFKPPIRTLQCKHTYCVACLSQLVRTRHGIEYEDIGQAAPSVECPTCKQRTVLRLTLDVHEKAHNSMLLAFQKATVKYRCPFDGCERTCVRKDWDLHVESCMMRKFICNMGCDEVLHAHSLHWGPHDCIAFLKDKRAQQAREIDTLKTQHAEMERMLKRKRS
jgi:hypothetical protein